MMDQENDSLRITCTTRNARRSIGHKGAGLRAGSGNEQRPTRGRGAVKAAAVELGDSIEPAAATVYDTDDDTFTSGFKEEEEEEEEEEEAMAEEEEEEEEAMAEPTEEIQRRANEIPDEPEDSEEEDDDEMDGMMEDLLQASTADSRARPAPKVPKNRMSLAGGRLSMAPSMRIQADGSKLSSRAVAANKPVRAAPQRVKARASPRKPLRSNPDPLPVVEVQKQPAAAPVSAAQNELLKLFEAKGKAPQVSIQSVDLLSLIDSIPDIAKEWDNMMGSSLDRKEVIMERLIESGKLESWVAMGRQERHGFVNKITQMQSLVNAQWKKADELELAAASSEALGAQCRCLEREVEGMTKAQQQLEGEIVTLKGSVTDANTELANALRSSSVAAQEHSAQVNALQGNIASLQQQLSQSNADAAEAVKTATKELKTLKTGLEKDIKNLEKEVAKKSATVSEASELTEEMEKNLLDAEAETATVRAELASTAAELEGKLAASEETVAAGEATASELKGQLAKEEMEVVKAEQNLTDAQAEFADKLSASDKMCKSIHEAALAVKEQLAQEQLARTNAEASLKEQTEVTVAGMKKTAAELKSQIGVMEMDADAAAADLEESQGETEEANKATAEFKERLHDTTEIAAALRNEAKCSQDEKKTMTDQITELKEQLAAAGSSSVELEARVASMQSTCEAVGTEKERLVSEVEEANSLQQRFAEQVEVLAKQMSETANVVEQLRSEKFAETQKAEAMAEQFEPLRQRASDLQTEKQTLADDNSKMEIRIKLFEENMSQAGMAQLNLANENEFAKKKHVGLVEELEQLREQCGEQSEQLALMSMQIIDGEAARKKMHNTICDLKGNIRVFCRVRPMMDHDGDTGAGAALRYPKSSVDDKEAIEVIADEGVKTQFGFDKVFPEQSTQLHIFNEVSSLVQSAIDGYKCCIFAYGQTGTGKTHTMQGAAAEERGIIPRSLEMIVAETERLKLQGWSYTLHASFLEIHNENIRDLLCDPTAPKKALAIAHSATGQTTITNAVEEQIEANTGEIARLMHRASLQRSVGFTAMNAASSRSHAVFRLRLEGSKEGEPDLSGVLNLIDLAGSERLNSSHATGERLKETQAINKSLSALGDVFAALVNGAGHVPFRNSKLTYLLQTCLGGNCKTLMLSNISPAQTSAGESLCSLRFASRVNKCELGRAKRQVSNVDAGEGAARRVQPRRASKVSAEEAAAAAATAEDAGTKKKPRGMRGAGSMANVRPTSGRNVKARR